MANNYKIWTVLLCTETGDHIAQNYSGNAAKAKAQRAFIAINPVYNSGISYVELRHGGKHGLVVNRKAQH
jgi:hypothetical protein